MKEYFRKIRHNKNGFTLIELVIVLAIMGIVVAAISSFLIFGERIFARGYDQYTLQAEVRVVSDFIAEEVRNVTEITLTEPDSPQTYNAIYYDTNRIMFRAAEEAAVTKTGAIIPNAAGLSFSVEQSGTRYFLVFTIDSEADDSTFDITTKVLLNNIGNAATGSNASAVYYK